MGQRANLITVENGRYTVRYDHWVANRLDDVLFWGAGYALEYFDVQEEVGDEGWLDEIWAEGGAVLDLDKKHLLWWGGEDVLYELPLRRVYLKLQKRVWDGWTIEWAHRGNVDLAEYVGYPKENVLSTREDSSSALKMQMPEKKSWVTTLGSIQTIEGTKKLFPLTANTEDYLRNGVNLVGQARNFPGLHEIIWADWVENGSFPEGGFFIDERKRQVEFWTVRECPNVVQELKNLWKDWNVVWQQDNYEFQMEKLKGKIVFPAIDEAALIERLGENLLREEGKSGLESALDAAETLRNEGRSVEINPWVFKSHHVSKALESKIQIWHRISGE
jgi:hypothetical protein